MTIPSAQRLGEVFLLDTRHAGNEGTVGVYLLPGEGGSFALIECGPAVCIPALEEAIGEAGFEPEGLAAILLTHIHLDHAGASGTLAQRYGAKVYVHEVGAPHLVDPSRLMASATRIYGEAMDTLWGPLEAVPKEQLHALEDGERLTLFGRRVRALYTPGHATHHLSYFMDGVDGSMLTGDSAAIKLPGSAVVRPATPPPEVDLEAWDASLDRMIGARPERLLLTHFGEVGGANEHLEEVKVRNREWAGVILDGLKAGEDDLALEARIAAVGDGELAKDGAPPEVIARHRVTSNYEMTVTGLKRYWQKHHPERLKR